MAEKRGKALAQFLKDQPTLTQEEALELSGILAGVMF